ncbi:MAG: DUF4234 domain-containing protein, partial [Erysipelotrichales bacterium]
SINKNTNTELRTPITAFILSLLTFGIYGLYYIYKQAEVLNELGRKYGCSTLNPFIILLLTLLLGVGALLNVYSASNLSNISENT